MIVNKANTTESLSMVQLRKLILGDVRTWPDKQPVMLVNRELTSDIFKCVLSSVARMSDAEYHPLRHEHGVSRRRAASHKNCRFGSGSGEDHRRAWRARSPWCPQANCPPWPGTVRVLRVNGKEPGEPGYPL